MAQALGDNIDYVQSILSSIKQSVVVTDNDGIIETMNPATCATTGWSSEELKGKPLSQLLTSAKGAGRQDTSTASSPVASLINCEGILFDVQRRRRSCLHLQCSGPG